MSRFYLETRRSNALRRVLPQSRICHHLRAPGVPRAALRPSAATTPTRPTRFSTSSKSTTAQVRPGSGCAAHLHVRHGERLSVAPSLRQRCPFLGRTQCITSQLPSATFSAKVRLQKPPFCVTQRVAQSERKIQSGKGNLSIEMDQVPKILEPMVDERWTKDGFIASFKVHQAAANALLELCVPLGSKLIRRS